MFFGNKMQTKLNIGRKIFFITNCLVLISAACKIHPKYPTPKRYFIVIDGMIFIELAKKINSP